MPSTYSPSLGLELMGAGDQAGNWGNTTNNNFGSLLEQAITGVGQITVSDDPLLPTTLITGAGIVGPARNAVLVLNGALTASRNLIIPSVNKVYCIANITSGGFSVNIKTNLAGPISVGAGYGLIVFCDSVNVVPLTVPFGVFNSNAAIGGDLIVGGTVFSGGGPVMPTGSILEYGGTTAPTGWLLCNGASVSRATYAALFAVIGTAYGSVDGSTFNVPDRRDRVAVGAGSTYLRGATGGSVSVTTSSNGSHAHGEAVVGHALTTAQMPSHTHGISDPGHSHVVSPNVFQFGGSFDVQGGSGTSTDATTAVANTNFTGISVNSEGGNQAHAHAITYDGTHNHTTSTLQPYVASNFIIKA